jgi:carbon monoxide dehydrogenase subunit G
MADGIRPDPESLERALDGLSLPDAGDLAVETSVLSDGVDPAEVDLTLDGDGQVIEAGERAVDAAGETVEVAVDQSGEVATVVFDTGGEAVEVVAAVGGEAVEGSGEVAAEAVVEVVAAALEG